MQLENLPILISLFVSLYILVLFFIAVLEEETNTIKDNKKSILPKVAIIVPAYNEVENIIRTVRSILNLRYKKDAMEVLVVDDGSTDGTYQALVKEFGKDKNLKIYKKQNGGKASAVNHALKRISKDVEYVGILDADSFVKEDALEKVVERFNSDSNIQAVTSAIKIYNPNKIIRFLQNAEYALSIWLRRALDNLGLIFIIPGPFSFYKVSALKIAGEFRHAHGTEDMEMGLRFQNLNLKIANTSKSVVYTVSPDTAYKLYKQRLRWTYGFLNNAIDYKHLFFRKGALGWFMLPMSVLSIVLLLINLFISIYSLIKTLAYKIINVYYFGIDFTFDPFYFHINILLWLLIIVLILTVGALIVGDRMTNAPSIRHRDIIAYLLLYGFIAPAWLTVAIIKTIRRSKVEWVKVNK